MSDAIVTRLGQRHATGPTDALWLVQFAGEILKWYSHMTVMEGKVRTRTITGGKSAQFPATYRAKGRYHQPGTEILGRKIKLADITITLDDLLIADTFIAQIDELKTHFDVRQPFAQELGGSLALMQDRTLSQLAVLAARGSELFAGEGGGQSVTEADVGGSADFDASGSDIIAAVNLAKQKLEMRRIPVDSMPVHALLGVAQWYLAANSDKNINKDTGTPGASVATQRLVTLSGVNVYKSTGVLFGYDVTPYDSVSNPDGVVEDSNGVSVFGTDAEDGLPADYPTKYHVNMTNTRGVVWVEPAVALLRLLGLTSEMGWDMRRQGTLFLAKMAIGAGTLRNSCAVEIKTA